MCAVALRGATGHTMLQPYSVHALGLGGSARHTLLRPYSMHALGWRAVGSNSPTHALDAVHWLAIASALGSDGPTHALRAVHLLAIASALGSNRPTTANSALHRQAHASWRMRGPRAVLHPRGAKSRRWLRPVIRRSKASL